MIENVRRGRKCYNLCNPSSVSPPMFLFIFVIEINIWKRNSTVEKFPIRPEFRSVFNAFDQSFDQFLLSYFLCGISLPCIYFYDFCKQFVKIGSINILFALFVK
jgi:hypothetical protein